MTSNNPMKYVHTQSNKSINYYYIGFVSLLLFAVTLSVFSNFRKSILIPFRTDLDSRTIINASFCPIRGEKWIVVTTIFYPTPSIYKFLTLTTKWNLIVIGDRKTPKDWLEHLSINTSRLLFLSLEQQNSLSFRILHYLPQGSYARKNLGYLIAIQCGAQIIFESDDDNLLETNDIYLLPKTVQSKHVPWIAFHRQRSPFVNIYGSFGHPNIWPRGFPIDEIRNVTEDGWHSVRQNLQNNTHAYIQQYLADLDPDVDAIYRLAHPLSIGRIRFDQDQPPIALQPFTFSPYNTQNTVTYYEAFWGLYLPVTTTFRVCDIWRGFWVQRLLWDIGGYLIFGRSTVKQVRNSHSYIKDMDDEYQLYHQSGSFVRFLASWSSTKRSLAERIGQLARDIAKGGFWQSKEVNIIDAWLADLHAVGYKFPSIVTPSSSSSIIQKRAAVCVTGIAECIPEAWAPTHANIRRRLGGDIDIFLFLSSTSKQGPVPLNIRLQQARLYRNSTVTVLYEDRVIDPHIPPTCKTYYRPDISQSHVIPYYQQIWGLAECFDLVKRYEQEMNIRYELFIRARPDSVLYNVSETLSLPNNRTVLIPDELHFGGYNDRLAIGPINIMETYMRRWHNLSTCNIKNLHAETFLKLLLNQHSINVQPEKSLSYRQESHGQGRCH